MTPGRPARTGAVVALATAAPLTRGRRPQSAPRRGAELTAALTGATVELGVRRRVQVPLVDADRDARDPLVVAPDPDAGNAPLAHGIDRVLRPVDR